MSQAANTVLVDRANPSSRWLALLGKVMPSHRLVDALVLMVILAATAICFSVYFRTQTEYQTALRKHQAAAGKVEELEIETERLGREIERLKTDPKVVEAYVRQQLGAVRTNEVVIKMPTGTGD